MMPFDYDTAVDSLADDGGDVSREMSEPEEPTPEPWHFSEPLQVSPRKEYHNHNIGPDEDADSPEPVPH